MHQKRARSARFCASYGRRAEAGHRRQSSRTFAIAAGLSVRSRFASDASLLEPKCDPAQCAGRRVCLIGPRALYVLPMRIRSFAKSPSPLLATQLLRSCGLTWTSLAALKHSPGYHWGVGNGQRTFQGGATNLSRNLQAVFIRRKRARRTAEPMN